MTEAEILAVLEAKRAVHPELTRSLGWPGLKRILAREGVELREMPLSNPARLVRVGTQWGIFVSSAEPARRHTYLAVHELAHLWLHVDRVEGREATVFHMDRDWHADPREDDAEYMAALILQSQPRRAVPVVENAIGAAIRRVKKFHRFH